MFKMGSSPVTRILTLYCGHTKDQRFDYFVLPWLTYYSLSNTIRVCVASVAAEIRLLHGKTK